jgi:VWFA-related protein
MFKFTGQYLSISLGLVVMLAAISRPPQSGRQKPEPVPQQTQTSPCKRGIEPEEPQPLTVRFNVLVTDINGQPRDDVDKEDFNILEDGVQQPLSFFIKREGPLNYGLVVDTSGSLRGLFNLVIDAANAFISANPQQDEIFLTRFVSSDKVELVQDWTSDQALLQKGLDSLFIEGGQSAIVDAVYKSANHLFQRLKTASAPRRSGLVLITDGEDRASYYSERQVLKLVRDLNIQVFILGFTQDLQEKPASKATNFLRRLAQESGGHVLFPSNRAEMAGMIHAIHQELSGQYFMGYTPTNQTRDNATRQIRIETVDRPGRDKRFAFGPTSFVSLCP